MQNLSIFNLLFMFYCDYLKWIIKLSMFSATKLNLFGATNSQPTSSTHQFQIQFGAQPSAFGTTCKTPFTQVNTFGTPTQVNLIDFVRVNISKYNSGVIFCC